MGQQLIELTKRANSKCELCASESDLSVYDIPPNSKSSLDDSILCCSTCKEQITSTKSIDANHWHCLNDSMWSEFLPVQVMAYRILKSLESETWATELSQQIYLEDEVLSWANSGIADDDENSGPTCKDSNGASLMDGDSVTLIKDLVVKGANFTAKRGTLVKSISLTDNPEHIEGRVNGTRIVLLTCFLKKV